MMDSESQQTTVTQEEDFTSVRGEANVKETKTDKSIKTASSSRWSELPDDVLRSVFERLSLVDFHRANMVCSNWNSCSKRSLVRKIGSPWLILFPEDGGCALYNPDEARVYRTTRDFSGTRFLANSGKWFLVLDSVSNLCIIDVFSEKRIHLPPLESFKGALFSLERVGDKRFKASLVYGSKVYTQRAENLRGLLWVDEEKQEYVVVWFFGLGAQYLAYWKNGEDHHSEVSTQIDRKDLKGLSDIVLHGGGNSLYALNTDQVVQNLKFSRIGGFFYVGAYPLTEGARFNN
ncbi:PREDICTED: F-box protein At5g25290-like [Camelina sativa]|uniref:F-box protein At5g25290-like n=1 Tax=Camelina sativa TaxID=90675 RepID=A0ABM0VE99_CAMSA|nr:PREDICTED: F-box protein At5g25290-like [Camelina sativa]